LPESSDEIHGGDPSPGALAALPQDLHYLIQPALTYGAYQFDEDIYRFMQAAADDEIRMLHDLGQTIREHGHYAAINKFLDRFDSWPPEVAKLYFLFGVLDALDVKFWDP
jgi:hypothetical protein